MSSNWMYDILLTHLSVHGYLGYFHVLAIMNNAIICIQTQVFVGMHVFISLEYKPSNGIAGS